MRAVLPFILGAAFGAAVATKVLLHHDDDAPPRNCDAACWERLALRCMGTLDETLDTAHACVGELKKVRETRCVAVDL